VNKLPISSAQTDDIGRSCK